MTKRIVFFNHKGGVSKTTSAYNVGWKLSQNHRVLLVDADPQCNLSSLVLGDQFEPYYFDATTRLNNIKDGVAPAFTGKPTPISGFDLPSPTRAPNLYLLPGHADLSEFDASLTLAFTSSASLAALQNLPGAFSSLLGDLEARNEIDFTIIDLNPGLSAINQDFFLLSDAFVVPTNPDPFSLMAITTLSKVLPRWVGWKKANQDVFQDATYKLPAGEPKFIGSLIQRFNVRNGVAARPYRDIIADINEAFTSVLLPALARESMTLSSEEYGRCFLGRHLCLHEVPDFQGLLPQAQKAGVPVFALKEQELDGTGPIREGWVTRKSEFDGMFSKICSEIVRLVGYV